MFSRSYQRVSSLMPACTTEKSVLQESQCAKEAPFLLAETPYHFHSALNLLSLLAFFGAGPQAQSDIAAKMPLRECSRPAVYVTTPVRSGGGERERATPPFERSRGMVVRSVQAGQTVTKRDFHAKIVVVGKYEVSNPQMVLPNTFTVSTPIECLVSTPVGAPRHHEYFPAERGAK